jgi:hypothetical protein
MHFKLLLVAWAQVVLSQKQFVPKPGYFPENGDDTIAGGIFCISLTDLAVYLARNGGLQSGSEAVNGLSPPTEGTGPYPAYMFTDPSLPKHTIYAPKVAPNISMPFITWGNGGCGTNGAGYQNLLLEIASYGYFIVADGAPSAITSMNLLGMGFSSNGGQSKWSDMVASLNWAEKGAANKYGKIDLDKIVTAGHSCGGLEAMSVAYHNPKVKQMMLFNIAIFQDNKRYLLSELKAPVAWFTGGPKDMGYPNVSNGPSICCDAILIVYQFRQTKTTISCQKVYQPIKLHWIRVIWVNISPKMVAKLAKPPSISWSGDSEGLKSPRWCYLTQTVLEVWHLITGMLPIRIGVECERSGNGEGSRYNNNEISVILFCEAGYLFIW